MRLPERVGDQLRIGVAVTIPEPWSGTLRQARRRFGDPLADLITPHVTLLGPTVVEPELVPQVEAHLALVASRHAPFVVRLCGTATFRPVSPVVFVPLVEGADGCAALERGVRTGILDQPLQFDYHPHVTVAHEVPDTQLDAAADGLADFEASFVVSEFHTYLHCDDGAWRPVRDFALGGHANGVDAGGEGAADGGSSVAGTARAPRAGSTGADAGVTWPT